MPTDKLDLNNHQDINEIKNDIIQEKRDKQ